VSWFGIEHNILLMRQPTTLLLLLSLAVLAHAQLTLNLPAATYQITNTYYSLRVPVTGGTPPLTYSFQAYPASWLTQGNTISIPLIEANSGGTWALKVVVKDALGSQLQRSLVIKIINGGDALIGEYPYN